MGGVVVKLNVKSRLNLSRVPEAGISKMQQLIANHGQGNENSGSHGRILCHDIQILRHEQVALKKTSGKGSD